ncbi:winged helix-turn-helix domain-containing protein [Herbidospora mongoliensis]|uniref:winged helix-turn-helix domain-containing protein n=1 Tax=Herbidospora mongoliensis TaxID=688067 RepID=UPI00083681E1|nr:winged helix-turn-helix domain-containing protein [Herbidospora mongoliensis]
MEWREDLPRWQQVARIVEQRISTGVYKKGRLISENGLMQEFGIARSTVRKATAHLRSEGLIYTRPNLGSFVGPDPDAEPAGDGEAPGA